MTDYDELINVLRNYALLTVDPLCSVLSEAADVIEELQRLLPTTPKEDKE